jgi:hypothetical protein
MDKKTVFIKTDKGESEADSLSSDLKRILMLIDNRSTSGELSKRAPPSLRTNWNDFVKELVEGGFIRDKDRHVVEPKITKPKFNPLKMFVPKPAEETGRGNDAIPPTDDLDFSNLNSPPVPNKAETAVRERADMEAAVAAAKVRASAEAEAKAAAKAKQEAEAAARARAAAEAKAKQEAAVREQAEAKAKQEAAARLHAQQEAAARARATQEAAAREKAAAEARVRAEIEAAARAQQQADAKAKQEAEAARLKAEQEAARIKAQLEAAERAKAEAEARVRAEIEAAARAQQEAEAKAKREAEAARLKADKEAARIKAELEAAERAKAEAEARVRAEIEAAARARQEAEAKAKQEAEVARLKAEKEAARVKAELEAAERAKAEAEARIRAELEAAARARKEAEEKARREAEAARLKAEEEAARVKAELEAAAKAKAEAEAARLKAEQEAARVRAELAAAKARAEAEAKAMVEARAKEIAEEKARQDAEARLKAEQAAARARAEQEAADRAHAEAEAKREAVRNAEIADAEAAEEDAMAASVSTPAFEIKLDDFLGAPKPVEQPKAAMHQEKTQQAKPGAESRVEAKAKSDNISLKNVAAEMERLKEEADIARRKAEEEAIRKAEEQALAEEQAKAWAEAEQRAKAQAVLEAEQAAQQAALSQAKEKRAPVRRKIRKPIPVGKVAFGLIGLALVVAIVLPYVYPLKEYVAPVERRLSALLKQPVHIGAMSAASLPPQLKLQDVTLGNAQDVKIGNVILSFDPLKLFSVAKVIGDAELQDVSIEGNALLRQGASMELLGSDALYPVRHLTLQQVKVVTNQIALPSMSGVADLDEHGAFSRISLHSPDDKLGVDLNNDQGRWLLGINLKESSLPVLPGLAFSDFNAKGVLGENGVNFTEIDAHIFDGILLGSAKLNWNRGWQLQGTFEAKTFDLDKMFPKYHVDGDTYGEGTFSMSGATLSKLDNAPRLDGTFTVKKGSFNVDMVETARLLSRDNLVGGRTHFDEMSGHVQFENTTTRFRQMKITSEMLNSGGSFDVSSNGQLSGNFNAEIKMRAGSSQLILYGTITEPKLRAGP